MPSEDILWQSESSFPDSLDQVDWEWAEGKGGFDVEAVRFPFKPVSFHGEA